MSAHLVVRLVALRLRVGVRRTRQRWRDVRPVPGWDAPLGPVRVAGSTVLLRVPRVGDGPQWRAARLASRDALEPWWPVPRDGAAAPRDWAAAQDLLSWTELCVRLRVAARQGLALPRVLVVDGVVVGQVGIDAVDRGTCTGELSFWVRSDTTGRGIAAAAVALVCLRAFSQPDPLDRVVAPVAVENPGPGPLLARVGFLEEGVLRGYRQTGHGRSDHRVWGLGRSPEAVDGLRAVLAGSSSGS